MNIYCKNCKNTLNVHIQKKNFLMSDKKAKANLQCAECLTDRTFFDKINDEYDLEQLIKHL